jgi:hypothetical protein
LNQVEKARRGKETRDVKSAAACYNLLMVKAALVTAMLAVLALPSFAHAQYMIVLKNGRQIQVQSYREDGPMIKFSGLGGEIAIAKDQVQSIRRANESDANASGLALDRLPVTPAVPAQPRQIDQPQVRAPSAPSGDAVKRRAAEEEKAYREKIKDLNLRLKELRDRYTLITRGNQGDEPQFFTTEEAFKGHQEDLLSRLRDAQNRAQGLPTGGAAGTPPFSLDPPPAYSGKQKELSDLRAQIAQLEAERQSVIEEMKAKNFDTASLILD